MRRIAEKESPQPRSNYSSARGRLTTCSTSCPASCAARVLHEDGAPAAFAPVRIIDASGSRAVVHSDRLGNFETLGIAEGRAVVIAGDEHAEASAEVDVSVRGVAMVEIRDAPDDAVIERRRSSLQVERGGTAGASGTFGCHGLDLPVARRRLRDGVADRL